MNNEEYEKFRKEWKGERDFCNRFISDAIRHANRNMNLCDDDDSCSEPHPSYYGEEFSEMVSNYNKLIDTIDELKKQLNEKSRESKPPNQPS